MTPQQIAERCAELMWSDDKAAAALGIEIVRVAPGEATATMRVRDDMVNGHDTCHGGFIFARAGRRLPRPLLRRWQNGLNRDRTETVS